MREEDKALIDPETGLIELDAIVRNPITDERYYPLRIVDGHEAGHVARRWLENAVERGKRKEDYKSMLADFGRLVATIVALEYRQSRWGQPFVNDND